MDPECKDTKVIKVITPSLLKPPNEDMQVFQYLKAGTGEAEVLQLVWPPSMAFHVPLVKATL